MVLPNPLYKQFGLGHPFVAIPIPYGWNAFYSAGHFMADTMWAGTQSAGTTAKRILQAAFESFSPIGSAGLDSKDGLTSVAKAASPTFFLPMLEMMANENRFGAPIVKEASMYGTGKRPDSELAFDSVSPISAAIAKGLNRLTFGDKVNAGWIDVNPGNIDYLINSYVPGIGAETYKFASWASKKALGYDTKDAALPLIDRLSGKIPEGYDFGTYRRAKELINTKMDDYKLNKENRQMVLKDYPNLGTAKSILGASENQLNELREARKLLDQRDDLTREKRVELYNLAKAREKELVSKTVRLLLQTNPEMRKELLASE
jgi:hypothetical protein